MRRGEPSSRAANRRIVASLNIDDGPQHHDLAHYVIPKAMTLLAIGY